MPEKKKRNYNLPDTSVPARMLTVNQAAAMTGATVWYVRNLAWSNKVPHVRFGSRILFDKADLDAYIDRMKQAAA
jgi:excisionase family DNA binding protein